MSRTTLFFVAASFMIWLASCETVTLTGRTQLSLVSASQMNTMSADAYRDFLSKHKISNSREQTEMVRRVGPRIQTAITSYMNQAGRSSQLEGYRWEFNLVEDPAINAFAMPGGKVVVYTGILPVARDDTGLAVVMGHEIGHVIANHGSERMSQELVAQMGGAALSTALASNPTATQNLFMQVYGAGAQVGFLLPYSRLHESEADRLGLIFMAMAGYDPAAAVGFWQRMAAAKKGAAPPEFLSTHPADQTRIDNIRHLIPEAMSYYRKN